MTWIVEQDLSVFAPLVLPWLEREPVLNNVLYSLIYSRYHGEQPIEDGALWARLVDGSGATQAVAIRTPPFNLLVSPLSPAAAVGLLDALRDRELPGVSGPTDAARAVRDVWLARNPGGDARLEMSQRMYELDAVLPPEAVPGALRQAGPDDEDLAVAWSRGFAEDSHGPGDSDTLARMARVRIETRRLWFWEVDGEPVSMACSMAPAAGVTRIGLVYTPKEQRRNGYASACVAAVSQLQLDGGSRACMLYTDLANPTSNAIYQAIGYRPVTDAEIWEFAPA